MPNQSSIDSLAAGLIQMMGSYVSSLEPSPSQPLADFDPGDSRTSFYVLYTATGQPLSIGHVGRNTSRGRQAPPADVVSLRTMPGATVRIIEVGDEVLAAQLARIMGDLFGMMLPFSTNGTERRAVVNHEEQVTEAPKRRGRPAKKGGAKGGRKRGRRPASIQGAAQDGDGDVFVEQPRRRGRKPGSKNKPKVSVAGDGVDSTPKKRGRPFGSVNKPKDGAAGSGSSGTPKRRPGRPRKNPS